KVEPGTNNKVERLQDENLVPFLLPSFLQASLFHKHLTSLGFCNVIKITEENTRFRGWLVRRLCYLLAVWDWKFCPDGTSDFEKRIFQSKRVQEVVSQKMVPCQGDAAGACTSVGQWLKKIRAALGQIQASLTPFLLRLSHWALIKLLSQMFLRVILHKGQLEMVHKAAKAVRP
uniref:Uncharacterized protein n=1 Tax=Salvator merianae TaxID=96440 RepID=A0A8D0CAF0_SALMN